MKKVIVCFYLLFCSVCSFAQSKADIFTDGSITFLGLDFTQTKFIGDASNFSGAGEVDNVSMKNKYIPAWNQLFVLEKDKFKVAEAVRRTDVAYATEVTDKVNGAISNKNFFSDKQEDFPKLNEQKIAELVKKYDFMGKSGIGLIFFVEGMKKGFIKEEPSYASVWVTFVDMKGRTVLLTRRVEGKAVGFGFRNFWAGAWKNVLKTMKEDWKNWRS